MMFICRLLERVSVWVFLLAGFLTASQAQAAGEVSDAF